MINNIVKNIFYVLSFVVAGGLILVLVLSSLGVFQNTQTATTNASNEYQITNYEINIDVSQDNFLLVEESITAHFSVGYKHGIYRAIPEISNVVILDKDGKVDSTKKMRFSLDVISANAEYLTEKNNNINFIRLGSADYTIPAGSNRTYNLTYKLAVDSRYADFDQFYFNVLGNMWDTTIDNFSATINFEKNVENTASKVFFGKFGSTTEIPFSWGNDGKQITIQQANLGIGEGVPVYVPFDKQYFKTQFVHILDIIILILIALAGVGCWALYRKGHNKTICTPVVQFTLKNKFTSADVGYLVDKKVNNHDIASLIIFWADKGYLNIVEEEKTTYAVRTDKEFENMKMYEQMLFNSAFPTKGEKVEISEIGMRWKDIVSTVRSSIAEENDNAFNKKSVAKRTFISIISGVILVLVLATVNWQNCEMLYFYISFGAGVLATITLLLVAKNRDKRFITHGKTRFFNRLMLAGVSVLLGVFCILSFDFYCDPTFNTFLAFGLYVLALYYVYHYNIRTDEGTRELGDIIGLREFILVAEQSRLEMLAKENPKLFFSVMPYAYVLGVYDEWCKKFEKIIVETPDWYVGTPDVFDIYMFSVVVNSINTSVLDSIAQADIARITEQAERMSDSIGGGTGGGFSGGGFGGGGGGSW